MLKKIVSVLIFSCFSLSIGALSPRLLITIDVKSPIKAQELADHLEAYILHNGTNETLAKLIDDLDKSSENHRIIIEGSVENLKKLARETGYAFINLTNDDIVSASESVVACEKEIPLTDEMLPRVDAQKAGLLYALMMEVDGILNQHALTYWATCGTLLGAVRHKGLIPWDDDLDICMYAHDMSKLLSLKNEFKQHGLAISMHPAGWYKIYFIDGKKIEIIDEFRKYFDYKDHFEWTYPSIDIFVVHLDAENKVDHVSEKAKSFWPSEYFYAHELIPPFTLLPFGPMYIPAPRNVCEILTRMYGEDWNKITYCSYDHEKEDSLPKIKVALTDRSTIPYVLPVR
jgi:lipopolysaccharide cholinephosphotransferase